MGLPHITPWSLCSFRADAFDNFLTVEMQAAVTDGIALVEVELIPIIPLLPPPLLPVPKPILLRRPPPELRPMPKRPTLLFPMPQLLTILLPVFRLVLFTLLLFILEDEVDPTLSTVVNKDVLKGFASAVLLPVQEKQTYDMVWLFVDSVVVAYHKDICFPTKTQSIES